MKKKILSLILAVVMLVSVMPMSAISAYATAWSSASGTVQVTQLKAGDYLYKGAKLGGSTWMFTIDGSYKFAVTSIDKCYYVVSAGNTRVELKSQHDYAAATCTTAKTCKGCATTSGSALGHDYTNYRDGGQATAATCTTAATHYKMCSRCTSKSGTYSYGSALGHNYTSYVSVNKAATCTSNRVDNYKCSRCTSTTTKTIANTMLAHSYTAQGTKVSDATIDSPAIYNKKCATCTAQSGTMQVGDKLSSAYVSYVDPSTGETVEKEATNDTVGTIVDELLSKPMQNNKKGIFLGWFADGEALQKGTNRFDALTDITAGYTPVMQIEKDFNDDKIIPSYKSFGLAGVQIREDNTQEHFEEGEDKLEGEVYGGLRYVASFSEQLKSIVENNANVEYGFVMASTANARLFADHYGVDYDKYEIKYNTGVNGGTVDTDYRYVTNVVCSNNVDHRNFDGYRLFTAVIDYEGAESLKNTEFVARAYVKYVDANGNTQIYYDDYDGTTIFGGCSISYNQALAM